MLCPSCHTYNRDNAKFCKKCGLPFTAEILGAPEASEIAATSPADTLSPADTQGQTSPAIDSAASGDVSMPPASADRPAVSEGTPPATDQQRVPTLADDKNGEDPALAPTQILTPQTMLAYQSQKWQHEMEQEHPAGAYSTYPTQQAGQDISEAPTMLIQPSASVFADTVIPVVPAPTPIAQPDIAEMPTILIAPAEPATIPPPPESLVPATVPAATNDEAEPRAQEPAATSASAQTTSEEEEAMEQTPPTDNQIDQSQQAQPSQEATHSEQGNFPVLAVGTLVAERYEVTQVISEDDSEHLYQVTDHQGFQHCWNCGSEENAEGDEFCSTCGAELLNASYVLHEFSPVSDSSTDSHVLQGAIINTFVDQERTYVVEQPQAIQASAPNGIHLLAASDSDAGDVRRSEPNEDSTLVLQLQRVHESFSTPVGVFIVADGMGGHENGQGASRMAIGTIAERMTRELIMPPLTSEKSATEPPPSDEDSLVELLHGAVEDANTAICQTNQHDKTDAGSTITGFMIAGDHAYILNVGDSRTYMLRDGKLYQLTNDHSLVGQLVAGGLIEPEDVYTHPQRSQIYRSLGDKLNVQIDIFKQQILPGDILLSCSDGLWEMVRNPQITDLLSNAHDPQTACMLLIEAANANGGEDNVSAVVVYVR